MASFAATVAPDLPTGTEAIDIGSRVIAGDFSAEATDLYCKSAWAIKNVAYPAGFKAATKPTEMMLAAPPVTTESVGQAWLDAGNQLKAEETAGRKGMAAKAIPWGKLFEMMIALLAMLAKS